MNTDVESIFSQLKREVTIIDEKEFLRLENILPPLRYSSTSIVFSEPLFHTDTGKGVYTSLFQLTSTQYEEIFVSIYLTLDEWKLFSNCSTCDSWISIAKTLPSLEGIKPDGT